MTRGARAGGCAGTNYPFLTSKERDIETGLDYFLARYYSSTQGRFTSPDEFKGGPDSVHALGSGGSEKQALLYADITNPQSLNKYQYAFNNPLLFVDPDGHEPQDPLPAEPGIIQRIVDNTNKILGALLRNFDRARDQVPQEQGRPGPLSIGDKQIQTYVDAKGKALEQATDAVMVLDVTGAGGTTRSFMRGDKTGTAIGFVSMAVNFKTAGLALSHFKKHAAEFTFSNAVQYVKGARSLIGSSSSEVARYVNSAGKVLVYNKTTNEFATHTGKVIHTYFRPKDGLQYVRDVIKKDGYKLIQ